MVKIKILLQLNTSAPQRLMHLLFGPYLVTLFLQVLEPLRWIQLEVVGHPSQSFGGIFFLVPFDLFRCFPPITRQVAFSSTYSPYLQDTLSHDRPRINRTKDYGLKPVTKIDLSFPLKLFILNVSGVRSVTAIQRLTQIMNSNKRLDELYTHSGQDFPQAWAPLRCIYPSTCPFNI